MKRILLIKLTSLGDVLHVLPALTDAHRAYPELEIDWVIDENFQEVATWHPAIKKIFTTNHRKWRKSLISAIRPISSLIKEARKTDYDLIIDGQGNFKTALLSLFMKGSSAGYDSKSIREPIASIAYRYKHSIRKKSHAIDRLRRLFALSLGYKMPSTLPEFLIQKEKFRAPPIALPEKYFVFINNASWKTKLWPEEHGIKLVNRLAELGFTTLLPWGNLEEKAKAKRLAVNDKTIVLPKLSLSEIGFIIARAKACICMDTGLSHLTAALNIPSVILYGSTDSGLIGANGKNQLHILSSISCAPCNKKICKFPARGLNPPCLAAITPEMVLEKLLNSYTPDLCQLVR